MANPRNSAALSLGDALKQWVDAHGHTARVDQGMLRAKWGAAFGEWIESRTTRIWLSNDVLCVELTCAATREQMRLDPKVVLDKVNGLLGRKVATSLRLL